MYNIPAVIFAGGKSSRMGTDKALLPFKGMNTLSEFQYQKLSVLFKKVYLSAKNNKFDFTCTLIKDRYKECSPLVGIISTFEALESDAIFILSVDAPLVNEPIIKHLWETYQENHEMDAIIAESPTGIQPLCGIYSRSILPLAKQHLERNNHRLLSLLQASNIQTVYFKEEKHFTNLNTPSEYEALIFR